MTITSPADTVQGGVRERKRIATRNAIQRAVLTLALERGFDGVTVEEISHEAGVSPRTFFNYFPTKEAAVIGDVPAAPTEAAVERFIHAGSNQSLLDGIRDLLLSSVVDSPDLADADIETMRRQLLREHPHLFTLRMASMRQLEQQLVDIAEQRLVRDDPKLGNDPERLHSRARLVAFLAFAAIKHAWSCWAEHGGRGPLDERLGDTFSELDSLIRTH
ncbi:MAG: TetR family transcriptional regulator [Humibacter sp.]